MGFRENLKSELFYSGMLVKELAAKTGVKKHTLDNYLSIRGRMPAADVAVRIAQALGVTVEYLITGCEPQEAHFPARLLPEIKKIVRIAEQLKPCHRKIALSLVASLKKHEDGAEPAHE